MNGSWLTTNSLRRKIADLKSKGASTSNVRTGINATCVYLETPQGTVVLFYTGRHHASEILDGLMKHRAIAADGAKLIKTTDGASKNFNHDNRDKLIETTCNAHAYLKFKAIKSNFPDQYAIPGEVYGQVFANDSFTKDHNMTPEDRMNYHAEHSRPCMEKLKAMCLNLAENRLVEPNSLLWEPVSFIINQWPRLIKFCEIPGVPLDTNIVEQALIMQTRYLAASFNYQTADGAITGDHLMSLIATAQKNGVEPVAYLEHCLKNHQDLANNPEKYFPWVYREQLKKQNAKTSDPPQS